MTDEQTIKATVKTFILNEFLPGEDPAALTDTTALVTTGILDSIAVLKAVTFLENQFGITIEPHEAVVENCDPLGLQPGAVPPFMLVVPRQIS